MDLQSNWQDIRKHFRASFRTNFHCSIASLDHENQPTVTPIGSLFLNNDQSRFYFEKFPSKLPNHHSTNKNICVLAVNSNTWYWLISLFTARFNSHPAIKLYGRLGERRKATEAEVQRLHRRMRATMRLKGSQYLWGSMEEVREVYFYKAEKINLGKMTSHL